MTYTLIEQYVPTLQGPNKKRYAIAYWRFLRGIATDPPRGDLTFAAAQKIRLEILKWENQ